MTGPADGPRARTRGPISRSHDYKTTAGKVGGGTATQKTDERAEPRKLDFTRSPLGDQRTSRPARFLVSAARFAPPPPRPGNFRLLANGIDSARPGLKRML
jgi:hypothetical protein